jgi:hypothetical protein
VQEEVRHAAKDNRALPRLQRMQRDVPHANQFDANGTTVE